MKTLRKIAEHYILDRSQYGAYDNAKDIYTEIEELEKLLKEVRLIEQEPIEECELERIYEYLYKNSKSIEDKKAVEKLRKMSKPINNKIELVGLYLNPWQDGGVLEHQVLENRKKINELVDYINSNNK